MTFAILVATIIVVSAMGLTPGAPTRSYLLINLAYSAASAVFGGYATAALAPARHLGHVFVLAAMIAVATISSLIAPAAGQPRWYLVALLASGPAFAVVGGLLRVRLAARRASRGAPSAP